MFLDERKKDFGLDMSKRKFGDTRRYKKGERKVRLVMESAIDSNKIEVTKQPCQQP